MASIFDTARGILGALAAGGTPARDNSGYGGFGTPPGPARGVLARLKDVVGGWLGPRLSHRTPAHREIIRERVAGGPRGVTFPWFLPYFDDPTGETQSARLAYRRMIADPNVKAAFCGKVFAVSSLTPKVVPASTINATDRLVAEYVEWNLTRRLRDGMPGLAWSILSGGLVDGYSVNEKVWAFQSKGRWTGHYPLRALKTKQVGDDVILQTNEYREVVGVMGLRYNAGLEFAPADFVIYQHMPFYQSPVGMSDFRAVYSRYWLLDTALKLRAIAVDKRSMPVIWGSYKDVVQQAALESTLSQVRAQSWFSVPEGARIEALNIAGQADSIFKATIDDLREEIFLGIQGATLQALTGGAGEQRGDSNVHKGTKQLFEWYLAECIKSLLNDEENGLIKDMVDLNFLVSEYPTVTFEAVDPQELAAEMQIDQALWSMGVDLSREELYERYGRQPPKDDADRVKGQGQQDQGGDMGGLGDLMGGMGGDPGMGDDPGMAFSEKKAMRKDYIDRLCDHGRNKGKPGPCPEEGGGGTAGGPQKTPSGAKPKPKSPERLAKAKAKRERRQQKAKKAANDAVWQVKKKAALELAKKAAAAPVQAVAAPVQTAKKVARGVARAAVKVATEGTMVAAHQAAAAIADGVANTLAKKADEVLADKPPEVQQAAKEQVDGLAKAVHGALIEVPLTVETLAINMVTAYTTELHTTMTLKAMDPVAHGWGATLASAAGWVMVKALDKVKTMLRGDDATKQAELFADATNLGYTADDVLRSVEAIIRVLRQETGLNIPMPPREKIVRQLRLDVLPGGRGTSGPVSKNAEAGGGRNAALARGLAAAWSKREAAGKSITEAEYDAADRLLRGSGWLVYHDEASNRWKAEKVA
jgi:hypothetical protein